MTNLIVLGQMYHQDEKRATSTKELNAKKYCGTNYNILHLGRRTINRGDVSFQLQHTTR